MPKRTKFRNAGAAYIALRPLIISICAKFQGKYGGVVEDYISESSEHFMEIWHTHEPDRATLAGDIVFRLWKKLEETKRTEIRRARLLPRVDLDSIAETQLYESPDFSIIEFMEGLPVDAEELLWLLFSNIPDIDFAAKQRGEPNPTNIRHALKEFLKDCGWTMVRIADSFRDVRNALGNK